MAKLIRLRREELEGAGVLKSPSTLYKWHSKGKYPRLFVKIGGNLYVDLSEWNRLVERSRGRVRRRRRKDRNIA